MRASVGVISGRKRDLAGALVLEIVELPDDLVATLRGVQLQRLERRTIVLLEAIPRRHRPPRREDVRPDEVIGREKIAKARQGLELHGRQDTSVKGQE